MASTENAQDLSPRDSDASEDGNAALDGVMADLADLAPSIEEIDLVGSMDQIAAASALAARMKGCPSELHLNEDDHFVLHEGSLTKVGEYMQFLCDIIALSFGDKSCGSSACNC